MASGTVVRHPGEVRCTPEAGNHLFNGSGVSIRDWRKWFCGVHHRGTVVNQVARSKDVVLEGGGGNIEGKKCEWKEFTRSDKPSNNT